MLEQPLVFSTREACAAAGITYRMLDYWSRCGAVVPLEPATGTGSRVGWSMRDVEALTRIGAAVRTARANGLEISMATIADMWAVIGVGGRWSVTLTA